MSNVIPRYLQQWVRELLGTREYMRAISNDSCRSRLIRLVEAIETGRLDRGEVRAVFSKGAVRKSELEEIFDELDHDVAPGTPPATAAATTSYFNGFGDAGRSRDTTSPPHSPTLKESAVDVELRALRRELYDSRQKATMTDRLLRELTAQVVLDAARIKGFEAALEEINKGSKKKRKVEAAFQDSTGRFFSQKVFPFLHRMRRSA